MSIPAGFVEIGKIVTAHGIKGELRVYPNTDFPERFEQPGTRWLLRPGQTQPEPIELVSGYFQDGKGLFVIRLAGVKDRTGAEAMRNCLLLVADTDRPQLAAGEFMVADLIGLPVYVQATQQLLGNVTNMTTAGHDMLEIACADRKYPILIPFVNAIVPVVDLTNNRIEITPPPGLLDL
jgi:16S rRNA processing protein RimM